MGFTVEDGTGITGANAYVTTAYADAHHGDRGNTKWTDSSVTTAEKQQAIVRATDYLDKRFGRKFIGLRDKRLQSLEWPRVNAVDRDGHALDDQVPPQVEKACAEYALRALLANVLSPDVPSPVPSQDMRFGETSGVATGTGEIVEESFKAGPVEETIKYKSISDNAGGPEIDSDKSGQVTDAFIPQYPEADMWIEELLKSSSTGHLNRV